MGVYHNGKKIFLNEKNTHIPNIYGGIGEKESENLLNNFLRK